MQLLLQSTVFPLRLQKCGFFQKQIYSKNISTKGIDEKVTWYVSTTSATNQELKTEVELMKNLINGRCALPLNESKLLMRTFFRVNVDKEHPDVITCSCYDFLKHDECKHALALLSKLKLKEAPFKADTRPLGQKRSRGRATKAKKALVRQ